jgi:murein DD-endopeptidase MepM/ murein hydrolase activator NlpD
MKQFLKPIGQCLTTTLMTTAMLQASLMPFAEAASLDQALSQTTESNHTATPDQSSLPAQPEISAPEKAVVPPETTASVTDAAPPAAIAPSVSESAAAPALSPAASQPATPASASATAHAAQATAAPAKASPSESVANQKLATPSPGKPKTTTSPASPSPGAGAASGTNVTPNAPATQPAAQSATQSANIQTVRQDLEKKLAAIVERDRATRETQLQQNLVHLALQYAQQHNFDQARQTAKHPALPPDVQTATLAQIDEIQAQWVVQHLQKSGKALAKAGNGQHSSAVPPNVAIAPNYAVTDNWGLSANPDIVNAYLSDRCISSTVTAPAAQATADPTHPAANRSTTLDTAAQSAAAAAPAAILAGRETQTETQANLIKNSAIAQVETIAIPRSTASESLSSPSLRLSITNAVSPALENAQAKAQHPAAQLTSASTSDTDPTPTQFDLDRMVGSALVKPLDKVGLSVPQMIPASLQSAFGWWLDSTESRRGDRATPDSMPLSAQPGLMNYQLLRAIEQQLPGLQDDGTVANQPASLQPSARILKDQSLTASAKPMPQLATAGIRCREYTPAELAGRGINQVLAHALKWVGAVFPLPIPAPITSLFGWRVHPILGESRFHSGVDIGAPFGTPVLASLSGRVVAADQMGGYGLAVVVETSDATQRNLYAHLSGIAVRPGTEVKQGTVLGWVGSTGLSTGPHLHFETQRLTASGWTAVDPLMTAGIPPIAHR